MDVDISVCFGPELYVVRGEGLQDGAGGSRLVLGLGCQDLKTRKEGI